MTTVKTLANRPAGRFARHYAEMVIAMFAGMIALGMPAGVALSGLGIELAGDAPAALLLGMGITMTVPMVAWMRTSEGHLVPGGDAMTACPAARRAHRR